MAYGMSYGDFWNGDPWAVAAYRRAYNLKLEQQSQEAWLHGLYVFDGVSKAIGNAFGKKGSQPKKYMEEPIRLTPFTPYEKAMKAREERQKAIAYFTALERKWEKRQDDAPPVPIGKDAVRCPYCDHVQEAARVCAKCRAAIG